MQGKKFGVSKKSLSKIFHCVSLFKNINNPWEINTLFAFIVLKLNYSS